MRDILVGLKVCEAEEQKIRVLRRNNIGKYC